jgi:hypothetical protein
MATFLPARVLRTARNRLRLGPVNVSNTGNGSLVNLADPRVLRDFRNNWDRFVTLPLSHPGVSGFDTVPLYDAAGNSAALVSGSQRFVAVELPAGITATSVTFVSGATAAGTPTNQWAGLYSSDGTTLTLRAVSADGTSGAWAADTAKTFTFATPYAVPTSGFYYVALMVKATTVPTLVSCVLGSKALQALNIGPTLKSGNETSTARTTPLAVGATLAVSNPVADAFVPFGRVA